MEEDVFEYEGGLDLDSLSHHLRTVQAFWLERQLIRILEIAQKEGVSRHLIEQCTEEAVGRLEWPANEAIGKLEEAAKTIDGIKTKLEKNLGSEKS